MALASGAVLAITALLLAAVLSLSGHAVASPLAAFWRGSLGTTDALASATLVRSIPLILAGLAVAIAFRAGVWNIGAEGQLLIGAAAAAAIALAVGERIGSAGALAALAGGTIAGGLWAAIAAMLRRRRGVLEVISTIMLNFIALSFVGYLVRGPLQEPTGIYPQSATLPDAAQLPMIAGRLHLGILLAAALPFLAWAVMRWTAAGFRLRLAGANPRAAAIAGRVDVPAETMRAFIVSGAIAGLAGAIEVTGVTFALYESLSPGYGYVAIAVALLARLHPLGVIGAGLLFGALEAGGAAMQRDAGVPSVLVTTVAAVLILGIVTISALRIRPTASAAGDVDGSTSPVPA